MKTNKSELLKALETVSIGLASKEMIEQSTAYIFLEDRVVTYNDEVSVSYPFSIGFTGVVPAKELLAFVRRVRKEEVDMEVVENELILKSGRVKAGITMQQEIKIPIDTAEGKKKWKDLPNNFSTSLKFCMGSCSTDVSRFILTNVHVRGDEVVEASDGYRISRYTLEQELGTGSFLIPAHVCNKIHSQDLDKICVEDSWAHFKTKDKAVISCRVAADEFPDCSPHLEVKETKDNGIVFPKELKEALERAEVFYKRDYALDEIIEVSVNDGKLLVKAFGISGWSEERLRTKSGKDCSFSITPYLLKDILTETNKAILEDTKMVFKGENWAYLTLLRK